MYQITGTGKEKSWPGAEKGRASDRASLVTRGGIVGSELPPSRPWVIPVGAGDLLLFATDGLRTDFSDAVPPPGSPQQLADRLLDSNAKGTDDALVLVARYVGPGR